MRLSPSLVPRRCKITPSLLVFGSEMKATPREKLSNLLADTFLLRHRQANGALTSSKLDKGFRPICITRVQTQQESSARPKGGAPSPHSYFLHQSVEHAAKLQARINEGG
jgi:hypothetical protein